MVARRPPLTSRRRPGRRVRTGPRFAREAWTAIAVIAAFIAPGLVVAAFGPAGGGPAPLLPAPLEAGSGATRHAPHGAGTPPDAPCPACGSPAPGPVAPAGPYPPAMSSPCPRRPDGGPPPESPADGVGPHPEPGPELWVLDGYNVLQVAVLRGVEREVFWQRPARERLLALARRFARPGARVRVVFDGPHAAQEAHPAHPGSSSAPTGWRGWRGTRETPVEIVFAPSADAHLLALARRPGPGGSRRPSGREEDGARVIVVTADRRLSARLRHRGVEVRVPSEFVAACRGPDIAADEGDAPA